MEKQSYISPGQVIVLLIMTRLPFSTAYFPALGAGRTIQDVIWSVPVNFLLNFLIATPVLMLLKRHPGKDLIECSDNILGKPGAVILAVFYIAYFLLLGVHVQTTFQHFYVNSIIPESSLYAIVIPMLIVCVYGAVKGMETIARFGIFVIWIYLIVLTAIILALIPNIKLVNLTPLFYEGPGTFLKAVLGSFNNSFQIVLLAFCAPFLRNTAKANKLFGRYNVLASLMLLGLFFLVVTVLGPLAAMQTFPLYTLSMQAKIGVFERLDQVDMISWIINACLILMIFLYFISMCLTKIGVNKYRRTVILIAALFFLAGTVLIADKTKFLSSFNLSPYITAITILAVFLLPLMILAVDLIKGRAADSEKTE